LTLSTQSSKSPKPVGTKVGGEKGGDCGDAALEQGNCGQLASEGHSEALRMGDPEKSEEDAKNSSSTPRSQLKAAIRAFMEGDGGAVSAQEFSEATLKINKTGTADQILFCSGRVAAVLWRRWVGAKMSFSQSLSRKFRISLSS
jgi:hypothetical protein